MSNTNATKSQNKKHIYYKPLCENGIMYTIKYEKRIILLCDENLRTNKQIKQTNP